jgi:hypothetical protein
MNRRDRDGRDDADDDTCVPLVTAATAAVDATADDDDGVVAGEGELKE